MGRRTTTGRLSRAAVAMVGIVVLVMGAACSDEQPQTSGAPSPGAATPHSANVPAVPTQTPTATPTAAKPPVSNDPIPSGDHPNASTTGVRPGTVLKTLPVREGAYRVTQNNAILDRVHIPGDLLITAYNVTVKNSQIDGGVLDEYGSTHYSFTISDSTVGPATGCLTAPGIGEADFTATRVYVRGHGDGFRASGNNVRIHDSYVKLCSNPGDHSDGLQTYMTGKGLVLNHTTIDQRGVKDVTAPVFIADPGAVDVTVTNNLIMGGTYSIQVKNAKGTVTVRNNMLVDKSWIYGPVEADCPSIDWAGNALVTIDDYYRVTRIVGPLPCRG